MLKEIEQSLEDEKIEEQKEKSMLPLTRLEQEQEKLEKEEEAAPVFTPNPDKPKTRKELRQERLRKEQEEKKKSEKGKSPLCVASFNQLRKDSCNADLESQNKKKEEKKEKKEEKDERKSPMSDSSAFNFQEVTEGTMVDVMDFMSKWANAIVTKVRELKECIFWNFEFLNWNNGFLG